MIRGDTSRLWAMAILFFVVQCAVGVLRPIKNAVALSGLGSENFYRVYLVSAVVVLLVPLYTWLLERVAWRRLIPGIALFFGANLLILWAVYRPDRMLFGFVFYGWYDLLSAALISQFFLAAQYIVDARSAKRAYPLMIAGGSIGATVGAMITGILAETVGLRALLLVATSFIVTFGIALPAVAGTGRGPATEPQRSRIDLSGLRELIGDRHIRLIALMVLVTIVVKQIVDYQFNALTKQVYVTDTGVGEFQAWFNAITQWLPLVALAFLRPLLRRNGLAVAVLMLPAGMILASAGLAAAWMLWTGVFAKATETTLRYSAERAGREILYLPVPDRLKLKAKTYIDVALEEGLGKVVAAGLIFLLLLRLDQRGIALVTMGLSMVWLLLGLAVRKQYVHSLARSIEGRFASVRGLYGSLSDATTWPVVSQALASGDPLQVAFGLDLIEQSPLQDLRKFTSDLVALLDHPSAEIRARALSLFERYPEAADPDAVRALVYDASPAVREAAVRAYCACQQNGAVDDLLGASEPIVRLATLKCIARGEVEGGGADVVRRRYNLGDWSVSGSDPAARAELALAAGTLTGDPDAERIVEHLLDDADPAVASTALLAAATLQLEACEGKLIGALASRDTREAARTALATLGQAAVGPLAERLLDPDTDPGVRRVLPSVLARIPTDATVEALLYAVLAPETDQVLDYRTIKALSKLRDRYPDLAFHSPLVLDVVRREASAARRYARAFSAIEGAATDSPVLQLTRGALTDAWLERREGVFRCLGLVHDPDGMYRCYIALRGEPTSRANALEWLEQTIGHSLFSELDPILSSGVGTGSRVRDPAVLDALRQDGDPWVAACAMAAVRTLRSGAAPDSGTAGMSLIETVFLLQRVDLLKDARGAHLALLASIAENVAVDRDAVLIREGEPTEALFVVTRGAVEMRGVGGHLTIGEGGAFGTWALIDEAPSPVEARAVEPTRLLRIGREEFHDLVGDHPELAIGLLQGLARRIRTLVA